MYDKHLENKAVIDAGMAAGIRAAYVKIAAEALLWKPIRPKLTGL